MKLFSSEFLKVQEFKSELTIAQEQFESSIISIDQKYEVDNCFNQLNGLISSVENLMTIQDITKDGKLSNDLESFIMPSLESIGTTIGSLENVITDAVKATLKKLKEWCIRFYNWIKSFLRIFLI